MSRLRLSINPKLALLVFAVGLPLCGILAWSIQAQFRSDLKAAEQHAMGIANGIATRAEIVVGQTRSLLEAAATRSAVRAMDRAGCDPLLAELHQLMPQYTDINTFNLRWEFVCSATLPASGAVVTSAFPELYERMKALDGMALSAPLRGQITGRLVVIAAYPVKDASNRLIGAVTAPIHLPVLSSGIAGEALRANAVALLVDRSGYIIASQTDIKGIGSHVEDAASFATASKSGTSIEVGLDGIERVHAYKPVRGTDWVAFAGLPTAWELADFRRHRDQTLAALLLVLTLAGTLAVVVARRISRPMRELQKDTEILGLGRLAHRSRVVTQDEIGQLAAAFNTMAQALETRDTERTQTEAGIRRLNRVHAVLSGINSAIVRNRERDALFRDFCRIAVTEGEFVLARLVELDSSGKARIAASTGVDSRLFQQIVDERNSDPEHCPNVLALALRSAQPFVSNDVANDPRMPNREALTKDGSFAVAVLPIVVDKRAAGAVILRAREAGSFDKAELHLLLEVVTNLAFALEHAAQEEKLRRLTRVYAVLSSANEAIIRIRDRQALFEQICRIAVERGRFKMAWIGTVNWSAMKIEPVASSGSKPEYLEFIKDKFSLDEQSPMGDTMTAQAIREKKISFSNNAQNDPRIRFKKEHVERGTCSVAAVPLLVANEAQAVLVLYTEDADFFDTAELNLLRELADNIAFAIEHIRKQDRLDYLAYYDTLTGLANRSLFLERVAQYLRSAVSGGHKLAVFFVDLERFRHINDSLGRPAGEALLIQVAEWLSRAVGDANLLARLGADHFAIVLPEVKEEGSIARLLDKRIRAFLEHSFRLNDTEYRVAAKIGAAVFPNDGTDADTLLRNAEAALKKAKAGGDRYLFYKTIMTASVTGNLTLENQLRQALEKNEFVLHYQPKISLDSGKLTGAEALIRWNDPRTGLVPPGRFIPILEETGLIQDVGRWALRQAIGDHLRWRAAGMPAPRIAVNVSPLQLRNPGFIAEIEQVLGIDPLAAAGLELEITESLIMDDVKHNIASLKAIRAMGVTIAIDDFGTGFSSLSYLAKLPVDTLKIDRSFVIEMTAEAQGLSLVSTIINLAHALKLKVVAEGVETEEQSRLLRLLRCDEMQGFLFSKPLPAEVFETRYLAPAELVTP